KHDRLVIRHRHWQFYEIGVGKRHSGELRLQSIERTGILGTAIKRGAGRGSVGVGFVALGIVAGAAIETTSAANCRADHHPVAFFEIAHLGPQLLHHAHTFMTENRSRLHRRKRAPDHMQIRAANGAGRQPDDRIQRVFDLWLRNIIQPDVSNAMEYNCFHKISFNVLRADIPLARRWPASSKTHPAVSPNSFGLRLVPWGHRPTRQRGLFTKETGWNLELSRWDTSRRAHRRWTEDCPGASTHCS